MTTETLERRFAAIGARVKLVRPSRGDRGMIDVGSDKRGEFFELRVAGARGISFEVVDVDPDDPALLLLMRDDGAKSKFLCGFDERHWFVAAIPEFATGVSGVAAAKEALQPAAVRDAVARVKPKDPFRRRNVAYVRQGEWFFLPRWELEVDERDVLCDEPLTRGLGKRHVMQFALRRGGEDVFVNAEHPTGVTEAEFQALPPSKQHSGDWEHMVRDPELYAKGTVRHPDHATIVLHGWHRVLMNTEHAARAMRHVAFLD